jgi:hypothetical protein
MYSVLFRKVDLRHIINPPFFLNLQANVFGKCVSDMRIGGD